MDYAKESLKMHYDLKGKIEVVSRAKVDSKDALSLAYTPGVAQPCLFKIINIIIIHYIFSNHNCYFSCHFPVHQRCCWKQAS